MLKHENFRANWKTFLVPVAMCMFRAGPAIVVHVGLTASFLATFKKPLNLQACFSLSSIFVVLYRCTLAQLFVSWCYVLRSQSFNKHFLYKLEKIPSEILFGLLAVFFNISNCFCLC